MGTQGFDPIPGASEARESGREVPDPGSVARGISNEPYRPARLWTATILAAIFAGVVSWLVGEATLGYFTPPRPAGAPGDAALRVELTREIVIGTVWNGSLGHGILGAALGLSLGAAGGIAHRSTRTALAGSFLGLVLGGIAGSVTPPLLTPLYIGPPPSYLHDDDLLSSLLAHGVIWVAVGSAGGLALGVGLGGTWRRVVYGMLGGCVGGLLGTISHELVGTLAFPLAKTEALVSITMTSRLFTRALISLFVAAGACMGVQAGAHSGDSR